VVSFSVDYDMFVNLCTVLLCGIVTLVVNVVFVPICSKADLLCVISLSVSVNLHRKIGCTALCTINLVNLRRIDSGLREALH